VTSQDKIYLGITAVVLAVIFVGFGLLNVGRHDLQPHTLAVQPQERVDLLPRHPLNGEPIGKDYRAFYPVAVMVENAADVLPQRGLQHADIVYEALVEGNITRLLAIFDSSDHVEAVGPVRSARNYFMDWADEYGGLYMHVGGSPQALNVIDQYDFVNIDQIGANEQYFWRDNNKKAPSNVYTSSQNWQTVAEIKGVVELNAAQAADFSSWYFVDTASVQPNSQPKNIKLNFSSDLYAVQWDWNSTQKVYLRSQGGEKYVYENGQQVAASNIIVQIVNSRLIDTERRAMDTQAGGQVIIYNQFGRFVGTWSVQDGRTMFFDASGTQIKLVPGKTWVEILDNPTKLKES